MRKILLKVMLKALIEQFSIKDINDKLAEIFDDRAEEALQKGNDEEWEEFDALSSEYDEINRELGMIDILKKK